MTDEQTAEGTEEVTGNENEAATTTEQQQEQPASEASPKPKGSAMDAASAEADAEAKATQWPEKWQEALANGDEGKAEVLKRFKSPEAMLEKLMHQDKLIAKGQHLTGMPDTDDPKELAKWRKENGVPDDPTGYTFDDDIQSRIIDGDKPIISQFTEFAHDRGYRPEVVSDMMGWYLDLQEKGYAEAEARDVKAADETINSLREEFKRDYMPNMQLATRFTGSAGGVGRAMEEARLPYDLTTEDGEPHPYAGQKLSNIPEFVKWAADEGRAKFGDVAFIDAESTVNHTNRIKEIEHIMNTDIDRYHREGLDKEYLKLTETMSKKPNKAA